MALLIMDTDQIVGAAQLLADARSKLVQAGDIAGVALASNSGMAGWDSTGVEWAAGYDAAARAVAGALQEFAGSTASAVEAMLSAADLYRLTESAAAGTEVPAALARPGLPALCGPHPPSASGGLTAQAPEGWVLISNILGVLWPTGDTSKLAAAAREWKRLGGAVSEAWRDPGANGAESLAGLQSGDVELMKEYLSAVNRNAADLASASIELGTACDHYAAHIAAAHQEMADELGAMLRDTGIMMVLGAGLSVLTAGGSVALSGFSGAARIGAAATRISAVLLRLAAAARSLLPRFESVAALTARIVGRSRSHAGARLLAIARRTAPVVTRLAPSTTRLGTALGRLPLEGNRLAAMLDGKAVSLVADGPVSVVYGAAAKKVLQRTGLDEVMGTSISYTSVAVHAAGRLLASESAAYLRLQSAETAHNRLSTVEKLTSSEGYLNRRTDGAREAVRATPATPRLTVEPPPRLRTSQTPGSRGAPGSSGRRSRAGSSRAGRKVG